MVSKYFYALNWSVVFKLILTKYCQVWEDNKQDAGSDNNRFLMTLDQVVKLKIN